MEQEDIPQDIQDAADAKYSPIINANNIRNINSGYAPYTQGRIDEREDTISFIKWYSKNGWVYLPDYDVWENLNTDERKADPQILVRQSKK